MDIKKSQKKISAYRSHKGLREGLSFSDYFDDSVPYEVKPTFVTTPTVEEDNTDKFIGHDDFPTQAKDLFKGLWETEDLKRPGFTSFWLDKEGNIHSAGASHLHWAKSHLKKNNIAYDEYIVTDKMYSLGFIKVSLYRSTKEIYFDYDKMRGLPNARQMSSLKNA